VRFKESEARTPWPTMTATGSGVRNHCEFSRLHLRLRSSVALMRDLVSRVIVVDCPHCGLHRERRPVL
jgi:hypothetical protein